MFKADIDVLINNDITISGERIKPNNTSKPIEVPFTITIQYTGNLRNLKEESFRKKVLTMMNLGSLCNELPGEKNMYDVRDKGWGRLTAGNWTTRIVRSQLTVSGSDTDKDIEIGKSTVPPDIEH